MMAWLFALLQTLLFAFAAPLLLGFVKVVKCRLQNRSAPSIFQPYRNLNKLFRKETIVADTASPIFRVAPYIVFGVTLVASAVVPLITVNSPTTIIADVIVLVGLFAMARFFLALAGMDVGTSFGGMGSSREMMIAAIAEPALLMAFFTVAMSASSTNLATIISHLMQHKIWLHPSLIFAASGFALVALAETGRIPVDNPATHLELTMIHEAMILEYSGRHLALMEWAAQIKFMLYCVLLINIFFPFGIADAWTWPALGMGLIAIVCKLMVVCIALGIVEICLAKLRLFRVPYLLNLAFLLSLLGVLNHIILEVS